MPAMFGEIRFENATVNPDVLRALVGESSGNNGARALTIVRKVSGEPPRPQVHPGWRNFFRNRRALRRWRKQYADWVAAGKPDREIRTYIPNVWISPVDDD